MSKLDNPFLVHQSFNKFCKESVAYKRNYILGTLLKTGVEDSPELRFEISKFDNSELDALCVGIDLGIVDFEKMLNKLSTR